MLFKRFILPNYLGSKKNRLYQQSRRDFYTYRNKLSSRAALENILRPSTINAQVTNTEINLNGVEFGSNPKLLIKTKGKPNYRILKGSILPGHEAFFYKRIVEGLKCIQQYHYIDGKLFFGHVEFRSIPEDFDAQLEQILQEKYQVSVKESDTICDQQHNVIRIHKGLVKQMSYLCGLKEIIVPLKLRIENKDTYKAALHSNHLEKLINMI